MSPEIPRGNNNGEKITRRQFFRLIFGKGLNEPKPKEVNNNEGEINEDGGEEITRRKFLKNLGLAILGIIGFGTIFKLRDILINLAEKKTFRRFLGNI